MSLNAPEPWLRRFWHGFWSSSFETYKYFVSICWKSILCADLVVRSLQEYYVQHAEMLELKVNSLSIEFLRNLNRAEQYLSLCVEHFSLKVLPFAAYDLSSIIVKTPLLTQICEVARGGDLSLRYPARKERQGFFLADIPADVIQQFEDASYRLERIAIDTDVFLSHRPDFENYAGYVEWLAEALHAVEYQPNMPRMNFNAREFLEFRPTPQDIAYALRVLGSESLQVSNINDNLSEENGTKNKLWALYVVMFLSSCGNQIVNISVQQFAISLGATASQTTSLTLFFNLSEFVFSFVWLWAADYLGRKLVFVVILLIYFISTLLLATTTNCRVQTQLILLQAFRAMQGAGALIGPLGFLIVADCTPPKQRSLAFIVANAISVFGGSISSAVQALCAESPKYNSDLHDDAMRHFFVDTHLIACGFFVASILICIICLQESSPRLLLVKELAKLSYTPDQILIQNSPMSVVCKHLYKWKNFKIQYVAYIFSLIGATNFRTGGQSFVTRAYGFTTQLQARLIFNTIEAIMMAVGVLIAILVARPLVEKIGELRVIIACEFVTMAQSFFEFSANPPIALWRAYPSVMLMTLITIFCDTLFIYFVSMEANQEDKGKIMAVFQTGNSIGRTASAFFTGLFYDYNLREAQLFNALFASVSLFFLAFVNPPLQRHNIDCYAASVQKSSIKQARI